MTDRELAALPLEEQIKFFLPREDSVCRYVRRTVNEEIKMDLSVVFRDNPIGQKIPDVNTLSNLKRNYYAIRMEAMRYLND